MEIIIVGNPTPALPDIGEVDTSAFPAFGEGQDEVWDLVMHITRKLRKDLTPWERKLWQILRNRGFKRAKFRRQFKIGPYVVDFCCLEAKLIIELDGGHHSEEKHQQTDKVRQKYLENLGFTVLRFWNNDIDNNIEGVTQEIGRYL